MVAGCYIGSYSRPIHVLAMVSMIVVCVCGWTLTTTTTMTDHDASSLFALCNGFVNQLFDASLLIDFDSLLIGCLLLGCETDSYQNIEEAVICNDHEMHSCLTGPDP